MVDQIIELENHKKYVILDEKILDNKKYYYGLELDSNEEPMNNYLFFEELIQGNDTYLSQVDNEKMNNLLLTAFTINYLDKASDEVLKDE